MCVDRKPLFAFSDGCEVADCKLSTSFDEDPAKSASKVNFNITSASASSPFHITNRS